MNSKDTFRVVTRGADGEIRIRDYDSQEALLKRHSQVGVDDCSTDLDLRGLPVFRGLIGPMPEGKNIIRYESPEVFETLTKDWSLVKITRRCRPAANAASRANRIRHTPCASRYRTQRVRRTYSRRVENLFRRSSHGSQSVGVGGPGKASRRSNP